MAKAGRRPALVPTVDWKCHIPVDVAAKIDLLLADPITGKTTYGAKSALVTQLLRMHLASLRLPPTVAKLSDSCNNPDSTSQE